MKKILIASTALVLTAGVASADVTLSGYGRFGLAYDSGAGAGVSKTIIEERMRVNIDASTTTDGGVTFGGRIRLQYDDGNAQANLNAGQLYAKAGGFRLDVGNIGDAIDNMSTVYNSEIGLRGSSAGDVAGGFIGYNSGSYANPNTMGIGITYSMGSITARVSYIAQNQTASSTNHETAVSVDYHTGALSLGAGYVSDAGFSTNDNYVVTAEYDLGNYTVGGMYQDGDAFGKALFTLYGNTKFGATTVAGYIASGGASGNDTGVGVGFGYDLGGATLLGSIHHQLNGDNTADLGVKFGF